MTVVEFNFVHLKTTVISNEEDESFKLAIRFRGLISVDESERHPHLYTFPFYCCFREDAPVWLDESVPYEALAPDIDALMQPNENERNNDHEHDYDDRANSD